MRLVNQFGFQKLKFFMSHYRISFPIYRHKENQENLSIDLNLLNFNSDTVLAKYYKDSENKVQYLDRDISRKREDQYHYDLYHFSFDPLRQGNVLKFLYFDEKGQLTFDQTLDTSQDPLNVDLYSDNKQERAYNSAALLQLDDYFVLSYLRNRVGRDKDQYIFNHFLSLKELQPFLQRLALIQQRNTLDSIEGAYDLDHQAQQDIIERDQENRAIALKLMTVLEKEKKRLENRIKDAINQAKKAIQEIVCFLQDNADSLSEISSRIRYYQQDIQIIRNLCGQEDDLELHDVQEEYSQNLSILKQFYETQYKEQKNQLHGETQDLLNPSSEKNQNPQETIDACHDLLNRINFFNDPALDQYIEKIREIQDQALKDDQLEKIQKQKDLEALIQETQDLLNPSSKKNQNLQKRIDGCSDLLNRIKLFNDPALDQYIEKIQGIQAQAWKDLGNPVVLISSEFEQNDHDQDSQSQMTIQKELKSQSFQFNPQDPTMSVNDNSQNFQSQTQEKNHDRSVIDYCVNEMAALHEQFLCLMKQSIKERIQKIGQILTFEKKMQKLIDQLPQIPEEKQKKSEISNQFDNFNQLKKQLMKTRQQIIRINQFTRYFEQLDQEDFSIVKKNNHYQDQCQGFSDFKKTLNQEEEKQLKDLLETCNQAQKKFELYSIIQDLKRSLKINDMGQLRKHYQNQCQRFAQFKETLNQEEKEKLQGLLEVYNQMRQKVLNKFTLQSETQSDETTSQPSQIQFFQQNMQNPNLNIHLPMTTELSFFSQGQEGGSGYSGLVQKNK